MSVCQLKLISYQGEVVQYDREPGKDWTALWFHTQKPIEMTPELHEAIEGNEVKQREKHA